MKTIICLHGGPGSGKSTLASALFAGFKRAGINAELNREYIKNWVWEKRKVLPGDQTYVFAKQSRHEKILMINQVEAIITDSPLILTHFYGLKYDKFEAMHNTSLYMLEQHHAICKFYGYKIEHFFVARPPKYTKKGRFQTADEARAVDRELKKMLESLGIKYQTIEAKPDDAAVAEIVARLIAKGKKAK